MDYIRSYCDLKVSPKFLLLKLNHHCDHIKSGGLKRRLNHESGALISAIRDPIRGLEETTVGSFCPPIFCM
jgi:hypothetical protein